MKRKPIVTIGALALSLLLSGCSGSGSSGSYTANSIDSAGYSGMYMNEAAVINAADMGYETDVDLQAEKKLIVNMSLSIETKDYNTYVSHVSDHVTAAGGYVETSDEYEYGSYRRHMSMKVRIPSSNLDLFLESLDDGGNVVNRSMNVSDVTLEYSDMELRIEELMAQRDHILSLYDKAETLDEMITVEDRLSEIRYELSRYENSLKLMANQVEYSTINLSIDETEIYTEPEPESFLDRCWDGIKTDVIAVVSFFVELTIWVISHIMSLSVFGCTVCILIRFCEKYSKKQAAKRKPIFGKTKKTSLDPLANVIQSESENTK